jgi:hypothetical protein
MTLINITKNDTFISLIFKCFFNGYHGLILSADFIVGLVLFRNIPCAIFL